MADSFEIEGLKEALTIIDDLSAKNKQKIIRGVLTKAANKNIKAKLESVNKFKPSKTRKKKPFTTVLDKKNVLGVISGVSFAFFHYRFLEFGTKPRHTKPYKSKTSYFLGRKKVSRTAKRVAYRGIMKPEPFIVRAIESNIKNVVEFFANNYSAEIKKRMDQLARKRK